MEKNFAAEVAERQKDTFADCNGIRVEEVRPGYARLSCRLEPRHLNPMGCAHGGLLFTMIDNAAGRASSYLEGGRRNVVTLNASVYYLRPASSGVIRAEARTVKAGRTTALACAEIFDESDRLLVRADAEFYYTSDLIPYEDAGGGESAES